MAEQATPMIGEPDGRAAAPKPSLGRIVLYCDDAGTEHPAIITRVWTDTLVNLQVFRDNAAPEVRTSVERSSETTTGGATIPQEWRWRWPPRV